jgi:hypothetical protein
MTITAANIAYSGQGPTGDQQQLAFGGKSNVELVLVGTVTFTGDSSNSTSAVLNYVDGTAALNFTPSGFLFSRCGGNSTATIVPTQIVDAGNANKTATVTFSATPGNAATLQVAVGILR